jgi:hypothetical protein
LYSPCGLAQLFEDLERVRARDAALSGASLIRGARVRRTRLARR